MNGLISRLRTRAGLVLALALAVAVGIAVIFVVAVGRDEPEPTPLRATDGECDQIDVAPYNVIMSEDFTYEPFMTFEEADSETYVSNNSLCGTEPDLSQLCAEESEACSELLHVVIEHSLWVSIDYDCVGFCFLTEEELSSAPEKEHAEGWDWAIPAYFSREILGEDRMIGGTYRGNLISIFQFENLQVTINLDIGYGPESKVTEEDLDRFDTAMQHFAEVNQGIAEDIRDSAIDRRDDDALAASPSCAGDSGQANRVGHPTAWSQKDHWAWAHPLGRRGGHRHLHQFKRLAVRWDRHLLMHQGFATLICWRRLGASA
jgi:hypothetical protein